MTLTSWQPLTLLVSMTSLVAPIHAGISRDRAPEGIRQQSSSSGKNLFSSPARNFSNLQGYSIMMESGGVSLRLPQNWQDLPRIKYEQFGSRWNSRRLLALPFMWV